MKAVVAAGLLLAIVAAASDLAHAADVVAPHVGPYAYMSYTQRDPRWADDVMGTQGDGVRSTIGKRGSAITSLAMALGSFGAKCGGELVTPGSLNKWLVANDGYRCAWNDCSVLDPTAPERFSASVSFISNEVKPSFGSIARGLSYGRIVYLVAAQARPPHFDLLRTATETGESFVVNDPNSTIPLPFPYAAITHLLSFKINVYPVYKQCNPLWGNATMGSNGKNICAVGCLLSSISSALAGSGIAVSGKLATPGSVNVFLQENQAYVPGTSSLEESAIVKINPERVFWNASIDMHPANDIPFAEIIRMIDLEQPRIVIANVMNGDHFVLVVGYRGDGDTLVVNDSGFNRNTYSYSQDVVGWRLFTMIPNAPPRP